jgi:lysozyme family protein
MANIDKFIPILLRWEASITVKENESLEAAYKQATKRGFVNDPYDTGGATMVGVTIGTYRSYCRYKGWKTPSVNDLKNMPYKTWRDIIYTMYWNKWKADTIEDQHIADMLVDWVWHSGASTIKKVQTLLGVTSDGIVGNKTIAAVNADKNLLTKVYNARKAYFEGIVKRNPSQKKWLNGWMNRINYIYKLS